MEHSFNTFGKSKLMGFSAVWRVLTIKPHGIRVSWDALGSLFCGPLGLFYYAGATWALSGNILQFFWDHLDPTLPGFTTCCIFLIYFFFAQFCHFFFYFLVEILKQLPVRVLALYFVKSFGSLPLILDLITQLLIIVNHFVSLTRGACIALRRFLFSQLLQSQFPRICIIY